ncbi:aldo/keto reductase [Saccharospirillum sp. MSK14-1]|uniref:aldo/keto reductase n=1 Tax=Saccharospirillum sp. MSK14-1 TaxID=1897632 RepID=UPI000D40FEB1|nr:aldo/keto reductase [Saccharospirillum sp. MSK14-1]PTY37801.1 aldo/keto reductase [Saccharospirillum sp. MSK14-1]
MNTLKDTRAIGLGCMNLSHAYGPRPSEEDGIKLLNAALDAGYDHLDTAALYGFGKNESLLGRGIMHRRDEFYLASKCGMFKGPDGKRAIDGRPDVIKETCEAALQRLNTEVIDLYYLHRWDKNVPIEDSVGAMADLVKEGKVRELGLSEVSADTLRKAHAVHPIAAVQTEYSLWTRNAEIAVIKACEEMGVTFVAFSPLARGYLGAKLIDPSRLPEGDIRRQMPRFTTEHYAKNLALLEPMKTLAAEHQVTVAQLALAWVLHRSPSIVAIPGTTHIQHMKDNLAAADVKLSQSVVDELDRLINKDTVSGPRYGKATLAEIDTEMFSETD